mmetsp:Transcript_44745/g.127743  ORF Transcript_44745/g.127743 Transcript_44745/m.127743 type:complete len:225 (-) Transcript_44745:656-1330(-)
MEAVGLVSSAACTCSTRSTPLPLTARRVRPAFTSLPPMVKLLVTCNWSESSASLAAMCADGALQETRRALAASPSRSQPPSALVLAAATPAPPPPTCAQRRPALQSSGRHVRLRSPQSSTRLPAHRSARTRAPRSSRKRRFLAITACRASPAASESTWGAYAFSTATPPRSTSRHRPSLSNGSPSTSCVARTPLSAATSSRIHVATPLYPDCLPLSSLKAQKLR